MVTLLRKASKDLQWRSLSVCAVSNHGGEKAAIPVGAMVGVRQENGGHRMTFSCETAKGRSRVGSRTGAHRRRPVGLFLATAPISS